MQYHKSETLYGNKWLGLSKVVWLNDNQTICVWILRRSFVWRDDGNWFGKPKQ